MGHLLGKLKKRPQGVEDARHSGLSTTALLHAPTERQKVSPVKLCYRKIAYIADNPVESVPVALNRCGRPAHFKPRPLQKGRSDLADSKLSSPAVAFIEFPYKRRVCRRIDWDW